MQPTPYQQQIIDYYAATEDAYKDSWDLRKSLSIHYGYWDEKVRSFPQSLLRMNEIMMEAAAIKPSDNVMDAGCGVGGSAIFLAKSIGCRVTGVSLSERQVQQARENAAKNQLGDLVDFSVMNYSATSFADQSFDVVWGCESICYSEDKLQFIKESFRLLKPGGRLVIADGFVSRFDYNDHFLNRKWVDGWRVNYLETPERFVDFMKQSGYSDIQFRNITKQTQHSARRLYYFYFLARLYLVWRKLTFKSPATEMQKKNIEACRYQFLARKRGLCLYGLIVGKKPHSS